MQDAAMEFNSQGLIPVSLRMQTTDESTSDFADIGFQVTVSGSLSGAAGYTDYPIQPQPLVTVLPSKRIGIEETQLRESQIEFIISHTWVISQMQRFGFQNPVSVFRDPRVIGLVYANDILSIESLTDEHASGQILSWTVKASKATLNTTG